jgi:hypothetical protein
VPHNNDNAPEGHRVIRWFSIVSGALERSA